MIQNKNFTYNGILNILQEFADKHLDIRRFIAEDEDQMSEMTSKNDAFPIMFVAPDSNLFDYQSNELTFKIFVYDRLLKDRSNVNDLRSKTNQILNDLDVWLRKEPELPFEVTTISTSLTFSSELMTDVTGWYFLVTIDNPSYEVCHIPFSSKPIISGFTCDIVYTNDYLTCESLNNCPTTLSILESVEELSSEITSLDTRVQSLEEDEIFTIELMDLQDVTFYAPYDLKFTSIQEVLNVGAITLTVNDLPYTLDTLISVGSKIKVESDVAVVINLITKI